MCIYIVQKKKRREHFNICMQDNILFSPYYCKSSVLLKQISHLLKRNSLVSVNMSIL